MVVDVVAPVFRADGGIDVSRRADRAFRRNCRVAGPKWIVVVIGIDEVRRNMRNHVNALSGPANAISG